MVTTKVVLDDRRKHPSNLYYAKVRVTFNRDSKYYEKYEKKKFTPEEFDRIMNAKKRSNEENILYQQIQRNKRKVENCIEQLPIFTFYKLEQLLNPNAGATDSVSSNFDLKIDELFEDEQIGSGILYECAQKSLLEFRKNLVFADITPRFLKQYENWMIKKSNTRATIGIYLRNLRCVFNNVINAKLISKELYPFGQKRKGLYEIPSGTNTKYAFSEAEIRRLYYHQVDPNDRFKASRQFALDMWKFSYLCNGINMKDILNLKWKNYVGDFIYFVREKTKRTKKETQQGIISVKDDAKMIIEKYGCANKDPESYIFPFYTNSMSAEEKYKTCYNVKRMVNKNLKVVNKTAKLPREPLFKTARYCFATALKRSKKSLELIQELLVHEDPRTTKNYVNSFENEVVKEETDILVPIQQKISDFKVDINAINLN